MFLQIEEEKVLQLMLEEEKKCKEEQTRQEQEEYMRKLNYRKDLQEQMQNTLAKREDAFQQFLKDKMMLDDIVRLIHEEDMRYRFETTIRVKTFLFPLFLISYILIFPYSLAQI